MPGRKSLQFCGITKRYGTSFDSKRWLVLDPCGFMGVTISWSVHIYAIIILAWKVIWVTDLLVSKILYFGLYLPVSVVAMISLYKATTTDPGAVPLGARPFTTFRRAASGEMIPHTAGGADGDRSIRRCHKCQDNYKPVRAHHDSITGRCIVKFDHFCPWVNNAIGALNHKFFCLFLLYTALSCFLSLALLLIRVIHCTTTTSSAMNKATSKSSSSSSSLFAKTQPHTDVNGIDNFINSETDNGSLRFLKHVSDNHSSSSIYTGQCSDFMSSHLVLALLIASIVFLIFTIAMSCEQIEAIETGKGKIARMKQSVGANGTEFQRVTEEFNEMFGGTTPRLAWHWLLPIDIRFPKGMKKIVLGYDWDPSFPPVPFQENNVVTTNIPSPTNNLDKGMPDLEAPGLYSMDNRNTYSNRVVDESTTFKARSAPDRSNSSDGMTIPSASSAGSGRSPLMRRKVFSRGSGSIESNNNASDEDEDYLETISIQSAPTDLTKNMTYTGTPGDGLYRIPQPESLIRKEASLGSSSAIPLAVGSTNINSASTIFQRKQSTRSNSDDTGIALVDRGTTPPSSSNSSTNGSNNNNTNSSVSTTSTNRQTIPKIV